MHWILRFVSKLHAIIFMEDDEDFVLPEEFHPYFSDEPLDTND